MLFQIAINNLISNAFKFSEYQPIQISLSEDNGYILIKITDNGSGIVTEDLEFIFKPFYSNAEKVGEKGQGMGLYMTKKIINLFKGNIKVESEIGRGSSFIVSLPSN